MSLTQVLKEPIHLFVLIYGWRRQAAVSKEFDFKKYRRINGSSYPTTGNGMFVMNFLFLMVLAIKL